MIEHPTARARVAIFYGTALVLAVVAALAEVNTLLYMATPAAAVLITMLIATREGYTRQGWKRLGLYRLGVSTWATALFVPLAVYVAAYLVVYVSGAAQFRYPSEIEGQHYSPVLVPLIVVVVLVQASLTGSLGEELGWRGYLLPNLEQLGVLPSTLTVGVLHAVWHLPLILLGSSYHADGNQLIVVPLFLVTITVVGMFIGYVRLRSRSVWPAVLAHSAHNTFWAFATFSTVGAGRLVNEYLAGDSGILILLGYLAFGAVLTIRLAREQIRDTPRGQDLHEAGAGTPISNDGTIAQASRVTD